MRIECGPGATVARRLGPTHYSARPPGATALGRVANTAQYRSAYVGFGSKPMAARGLQEPPLDVGARPEGPGAAGGVLVRPVGAQNDGADALDADVAKGAPKVGSLGLLVHPERPDERAAFGIEGQFGRPIQAEGEHDRVGGRHPGHHCGQVRHLRAIRRLEGIVHRW